MVPEWSWLGFCQGLPFWDMLSHASLNYLSNNSHYVSDIFFNCFGRVCGCNLDPVSGFRPWVGKLLWINVPGAFCWREAGRHAPMNFIHFWDFIFPSKPKLVDRTRLLPACHCLSLKRSKRCLPACRPQEFFQKPILFDWSLVGPAAEDSSFRFFSAGSSVSSHNLISRRHWKIIPSLSGECASQLVITPEPESGDLLLVVFWLQDCVCHCHTASRNCNFGAVMGVLPPVEQLSQSDAEEEKPKGPKSAAKAATKKAASKPESKAKGKAKTTPKATKASTPQPAGFVTPKKTTTSKASKASTTKPSSSKASSAPKGDDSEEEALQEARKLKTPSSKSLKPDFAAGRASDEEAICLAPAQTACSCYGDRRLFLTKLWANSCAMQPGEPGADDVKVKVNGPSYYKQGNGWGLKIGGKQVYSVSWFGLFGANVKDFCSDVWVKPRNLFPTYFEVGGRYYDPDLTYEICVRRLHHRFLKPGYYAHGAIAWQTARFSQGLVLA